MAELSQIELELSNVIQNCAVDENMYDSSGPEDNIIARLNELRKWQESQQQLLNTNQLNQRELLQMEKRKLYEMLKVSLTSTQDGDESKSEESDDSDGDSNGAGIYEVNVEDDGSEGDPNANDTPSIEALNDSRIEQLMARLAAVKFRPNSDEHAQDPENKTEISKRPFLKRGDGLKSRFRMHPSAFLPKNLPKYKYAHTTQALLQRKRNSAKGDGRTNNKSNNNNNNNNNKQNIANGKNVARNDAQAIKVKATGGLLNGSVALKLKKNRVQLQFDGNNSTLRDSGAVAAEKMCDNSSDEGELGRERCRR